MVRRRDAPRRASHAVLRPAEGWKDRWVSSKKKGSEAGEFKWTAGKFYGDAEKDKGRVERTKACLRLIFPPRRRHPDVDGRAILRRVVEIHRGLQQRRQNARNPVHRQTRAGHRLRRRLRQGERESRTRANAPRRGTPFEFVSSTRCFPIRSNRKKCTASLPTTSCSVNIEKRRDELSI